MTDGKPGVMLYFDLLPAVRMMSVENRGELFLAILEYAQDGIEPLFDCELLKVMWPLVRAKIDADDTKYTEKQLQAKHAAYCRAHEKVDFETWYTLVYARQRTLPGGNGLDPSTSTSTATSTKAVTHAPPETTTKPAPETPTTQPASPRKKARHDEGESMRNNDFYKRAREQGLV